MRLMQAKHLQCTLNFLALLTIVYGRAAPISDCTAQAWVRAPDLSPNTVVQGDARVKISAECPAIDSVLLGLRFKERSFLKVLGSREDVTQLNDPVLGIEFLSAAPWPSDSNHSRLEAYEALLTNKGRWIVREEERAVFETTLPFEIGTTEHGVLRDAVQDFAVLVPSTNFPPGLERMVPGALSFQEIVMAEWVYEYFAQVTFSDGSMKDISAGFTSFQPVHDPANAVHGPSSATALLNPPHGTRRLPKNTQTANYSVEISADPGLTFFAGTKRHAIDAVVTRTGFARAFTVPLDVSVCIKPKVYPKWAAEYDMSNSNVLWEFDHLPPSVLRTPLDGRKQMPPKIWLPGCPYQHAAHIWMPNSTTDEIRAEEIVTTTSARFTIPFELDDTYIPNFETYYQTLHNSLIITLKAPPAEFDDVDSDEEAWVPLQTRRHPAAPGMSEYSGNVSVIVRLEAEEVALPQRCLDGNTAMAGQAVLSDDVHCNLEQHPLTHYLDEGARGPIFVGRSAVQALPEEDPAARALRAPILQPVVSSPPEGEERVSRYHPPIDAVSVYVGETWAERVAHRNLTSSAEVSASAMNYA